MFQDYTMRIVAVREWQGAAQAKQQAMLPTSPGIYVWTLDLRRPLGEFPCAGDALLSELNEALHPHKPRRFDGKIQPYAAVTLHDQPPPLTKTTVGEIEKIASMDSVTAEWAFLCPTMLQRPLYVGKAKNLRDRLQRHLKGKTKLVEHLDGVGFTLNDCAIMVAEVQPAPQNIANEDELLQEDRDEFEDESLDGLDPAIKALISAAESLTIRMSRPLLNERMD
ncbi:MAG: hypothetical protein OXH86_09250 [Acidimicrobiaceae bacterium]|nr:hypothetical protein [Acidimicrobiaceae bacterium]